MSGIAIGLAACNTVEGAGKDVKAAGQAHRKGGGKGQAVLISGSRPAKPMQAFRIHTGLVAPLDRANVDTDAIIPKQFLKSIKRSGFGPNLFDAWRYLDHGEPGMDHTRRGRATRTSC